MTYHNTLSLNASFIYSLVPLGCSAASASVLAEQFGTYMTLHRAIRPGLAPGLSQGPGLSQRLGHGLGQGHRPGRVLTEEDDEENITAATGNTLS